MAITNASRLADFGSGIGTAGAVLQIDNSANEVGIGTTNPNATLTVGNIGASGTSIYVHGDGRITGVITATKFSGGWDGALSITDATASTSTSTGALIVSGGVGIAKSLFVGEGVSVAGTITYDDVTNIDSVGIVTAGKGFRATTGGIIVTAGVSTLSGGVDVSTTKPITLGTGTTIHQVASNTLALGTNDETRIQIESDGVTHISNNPTDSAHWNSYNCHLLHTDATDFTCLIENSHDSNPNCLGLHMSDDAPNDGSSTYLQCYDTASGGGTTVRAKITSDGTVTATGGVISGTTPDWGNATSTGIELNPAAATNWIGIKNSSGSTATNTAFQITYGTTTNVSFLNNGAATFEGTLSGKGQIAAHGQVVVNGGGLIGDSAEALVLWDDAGTTKTFTITGAGIATASKFSGPGNIPAGQTGTVTLAASDAGKHVAATGTVTLGTGIFAVGDAVTIYNNSAGDITITLSAVTCYNAADGSTGNRTLGARGLATILCTAANTYVISGAGLT